MRVKMSLAVTLGLVAASTIAQGQMPGSSEDPGLAEARTWLRNNNRWGPDHRIVGDMTATIETALSNERNTLLVFGGGLLSSGRPHVLWVADGAAVAIELTDEDASGLELGNMSSQVTEVGRHSSRANPPECEIADLSIDGGTALARGGRIQGHVTITPRGELSGQVGVRMTYTAGKGSTTSSIHYPDSLPGEAGTLSFDFEVPEGEGVVPALIDIVRIDQSATTPEFEVLSNTLGIVFVIGS